MAGMPVGISGIPEGMAGKPAGNSGMPEGMAGIPEGMAPKRLPNPPLLPPSEPESLLSDPLPAPEIWNIDVNFLVLQWPLWITHRLQQPASAP
jgi:hypothetical protein